MSNRWLPPSHAQMDHVRELRWQLKISDAVVERHCLELFGCGYLMLDRKQMRALIDQMEKWVKDPAAYQRSQGQMSLLDSTA